MQAVGQPYSYYAFGLSIASSHRIATLAECRAESAQSAQVQIERVPANYSFGDLAFANSFANWQASPNRLLLSIEGIAQFLIEDGNSIQIKPAPDADESVISAFLTGSAFAALLQQRKMLTIHASAVMTDAGAVMFVGRSGVGKSTTLAALYQRGHAMVTDDVAAIRFDNNGQAIIAPSFVGGRVTGKALEQIGHQRGDYTRLNGEIEKYAFPMALTDQAAPKIALIVVLDVWEKPELNVAALNASEAFQILSRFSFRKRFYDGMEMQHFHFESVTKLVNAVPVRRIHRPDQPFMLGELITAIEGEISQSSALQRG